MIGDHLEDQEQVFEFKPAKHTLDYFKYFLGMQRVSHQLYDLNVGKDSCFVEKVNDRLHLLKDADVCWFPEEIFHCFCFIEPVDQKIFKLFPFFGFKNQVIDDSKALEFFIDLLAFNQEPFYSAENIFLHQLLFELANHQQLS